MSDLSVPCPAVVRVSITASASHRCPYRDEMDHGTVRVSWTTSFGETVELHALAALIHGRADAEISHEQWTAAIAAQIGSAVVVADLTVTSEWATAGLDVSVGMGDIGGSTLKGGPTDG